MLLVNYTAIVQFSIFSKNSLYPLQKTNLVPNRIPYWNQNFLTQIFTEIFLTSPPLHPVQSTSILEDRVHAMILPNKQVPKQIANLQTMTK